MALLTIPATPEKGTSQEYTLNVTDLIALVSEAYFQDQANWSKVVLVYQSSVSNQLEVINFIPDGVSTEISELAEFSEFARDLFEVNSITIFDKQNGRYIIKASSIPDVANYEIDFAVTPSVGIPFQLFANYQSFNPLTDPTILSRTVDGFSTPVSQALHNISLGTIVNGEANYDITFNLSELTANLGYGLHFGVLGSTQNPESVTLGEIFNNFETTSATCLMNSGTHMNIVTSYSGGNTSFIVPTGATKTVRIKQQGTTLEYYVNSTLITTVTVSSSVNIPYLYPYLRSSWTYTVDSVTVVASSTVKIQQLQAFTNNGGNVGGDSLGNGQTITPQESFLLTGCDFIFSGPDVGSPGQQYYVNLRDISASSILATSTTASVAGQADQFVRVDFASFPLVSGTSYILEVVYNGVGAVYLLGTSDSNSYPYGQVYAFGGLYPGDRAFKVYGI